MSNIPSSFCTSAHVRKWLSAHDFVYENGKVHNFHISVVHEQGHNNSSQENIIVTSELCHKFAYLKASNTNTRSTELQDFLSMVDTLRIEQEASKDRAYSMAGKIQEILQQNGISTNLHFGLSKILFMVGDIVAFTLHASYDEYYFRVGQNGNQIQIIRANSVMAIIRESCKGARPFVQTEAKPGNKNDSIVYTLRLFPTLHHLMRFGIEKIERLSQQVTQESIDFNLNQLLRHEMEPEEIEYFRITTEKPFKLASNGMYTAAAKGRPVVK